MQKIGKFEIIEQLGRGAMGTVYKGHDPSLARHVAIKVMTARLELDPELRTRFFREAQAAGSLQHPNIITVFELGEADGHPFIAMEFVPGRDLDDIIAAREPLTVVEKVELIEQVCRGLAYAHERRIIHRDVKPANIRVSEMGQVKLMDFGVAHLLSSELTQSGSLIGTPYYMAPEIINGRTVDLRADIFSLGATFYELLSYTRPFHGESLQAVFQQILQKDPVPLRELGLDVPPVLNGVLDRSLAKLRDDRYADTGEFLNDLMQFWESLPAPAQARAAASTGLGAAAAKAATAARRRWRKERLIPVVAGAAVAAAGLVIVGGALFMTLFDRPVTPGNPPAERSDLAATTSGQPAVPERGAAEADLGLPASESGVPEAEAAGGRPSPNQPAPTGGVEADPPNTPQPAAPQPVAEPRRSAAAIASFEAASQAADEARSLALEASALQLAAPPFQRAETLRERAVQAAAEGRYSEAVQSLAGATTAYGSARETALSWRARLDSAWDTLGSLRAAAHESAPEYGQAEQLRLRALEAQFAGNPAEALAHLASASQVYRLAVRPVDNAAEVTEDVPAMPEPAAIAPELSPAEIVEATLSELRAAIEAEDVTAVRRVWPGLSAQQLSTFESSFGLMRDLEVGFAVQSMDASGDRIDVSVRTTYEFRNEDTRRRETQTFSQVLELAERNGRWVIVGSRG